MLRRSHVGLMVLVLMCLFANAAHAVYEKPDGFPWNLTLHGDHDAPIAQALPNGSFFMNVGPTGIRAQITHDYPAFFTVKFVFPNSPAHGKINAGDIIIGANGHVMNVDHQFGRRRITGWEGPMVEMSKLIEDSQGKDGKLELIVWPGGDRSKKKTVTVEIEAVGRFSKTFPFNCPRSDKLMIQLCDFLAREYERKGRFEGRVHTHSASVLALMASGDKKYMPIVHKALTRYENKRYNSMNGTGFQCWNYGHDGIVMGEYYLLTKQKRLLPAMKSLANCMAEAQDPSSGGYMHRPYPFITKRIADGGAKGYGSMAGVAGLSFVAMSIFRVAEVEYPEWTYQRLHQAYIKSTGPNGEVGYGFRTWDHAVIKPKGDSTKVLEKAKAIGYKVQIGMEGIDDFDVVWPTKADPRFKPLGWIKSEADKVIVYKTGDNQLTLIRDMTLPEPKGTIPHNGRTAGHIFRSGCGALGHTIGHADDDWKYMARHLGDSCANSPNALLDGHASTLLHTLWGSLGAACSNERGFRHYMDGIKWWFIMAQTHDGSFVCMPGRDYASTDHVYANRNFPTATAALILSVKERKLQITGAGSPSFEIPSGDDDQPDTPKAADNSSELKPFGDDFTVVHCKREAKALAGDATYTQVLRMLQVASARDDDYGKEAAQFLQRLQEHIEQRNYQMLLQSMERPAQTLAQSRDHLRRMSGLDGFGSNQARAMVHLLAADRDILMVANYYSEYEKIREAEARRGESITTKKNMQQLRSQLERFLNAKSHTEEVLGEANRLLAMISVE